MSFASAFPELPEDADALPAVPGGWTKQQIPLAGRELTIFKPGHPDLFLDDERVQAENEQNDYMPYWAFLWPSALQMAKAMTDAEWPVGTEVLELGAGLGVVGLASLMRGDRVTFSDYDPTALHLCRLNARLNGLPGPELICLDWRMPLSRRFPVIIGCEVTYDAAMHPVLVRLLEQMLAPDGVCWLGDPVRFHSQAFCSLAESRGFRVERLEHLTARNPVPGVSEFQILRLTRQ